jgi:hypothetical protein
MSNKKLTAEEFVRRVLAKSFGQNVDKETVLEVAKKVRQAVATKQKPSRDREAA